MPDSITLERSDTTSTYTGVAQHSWVLEVKATSNLPSLDSRIFVWQVNSPGSAYSGDRWSVVASTQQMADLPPDAPVIEGDEQIPFYRKDTLVIDCRSPELREELWEKIQENVKDLLVNWLALENTELVETVEITP